MLYLESNEYEIIICFLGHQYLPKNYKDLLNINLPQWITDLNGHQIKRNFSDERSFKLTKALLVTKLSRFEFEQHRNSNLNPNQLEKAIRHRGTDYEAILYFHKIQKDFQQKVVQGFTELGVQVQVANRFVMIILLI